MADDGVVFTRQKESGLDWEYHYCIDFNPGFHDLPSQQDKAVSTILELQIRETIKDNSKVFSNRSKFFS